MRPFLSRNGDIIGMLLAVAVFIVGVYFTIGFGQRFSAPVHAGTTITWDGGGGDGLWNTATNWDINQVPTSTSDVIASSTTDITVASGQTADFGTLQIGNGTVSTTLVLIGNIGTGGSITIKSKGTLEQKNAVTQTITGTFTIESGGVLTHTDNSSAQSYEVDFSVATLDLQSGSSVNVDGKGYDGGTADANGQGPAGGFGLSSNADGSGGAHGGDGGGEDDGVAPGGVAYCDVTNPATIGAGGGGGRNGASANGGAGGGLIQISASGSATFAGNVTADGGDGASGSSSQYSGGGGGGGINIQVTGDVSGAGVFSMIGGRGGDGASNTDGGGGGGGCMLLSHGGNNAVANTSVTMDGGDGGDSAGGGSGVLLIKKTGENGILYLNNTGSSGGSSNIAGRTSTQTTSTLTIDAVAVKGSAQYVVSSTKSLIFASTTSPLANGDGTGILRISSGTITPSTTSFTIASTTFEIWQTGTLTNSSTLAVTISASGTLQMANFATTTALSLSSLTIQDRGLLTHTANSSTQQHVINLSLGTLEIQSGGAVNVDGRGYAGGELVSNGRGPTGSFGQYATTNDGSGGGHGGAGGADAQSDAGGSVYCATSSPATIGAGGGGAVNSPATGGAGGGLIRITVTNTSTLNGIISADGANAGAEGATNSVAGGGAGGGIYITANSFAGSFQSFTAIGGDASAGGANQSQGGAGGGGCIYLFYTVSTTVSTSSMSVAGGATNGSSGALNLIQDNQAPTLTTPTMTTSTLGTGDVTIRTQVNDADLNAVKMKMEYKSGNCTSYSGQVTSTVSSTISATYGQSSITVNNAASDGYQIQTVTTTSGANTVTSTWMSDTDVPTADGLYCVFLTPNDGTVAGTTVSSTVTLDNVNPAAPGTLTVASSTASLVTLTFGSSASDTNEPSANAYKLFYKHTTSGVTQSDTEQDSANFNSYAYGGGTSVDVGTLSPNKVYYFNIFSFDSYGNFATSTEVSTTTRASPAGTPTVTSVSTSSINVTVTANGNPSDTEYAVYETGTGKYVSAAETLTATEPVWQTMAVWDDPTVTGLSVNTSYTFQVISRNGGGFAAATTSASAIYTRAAVPSTFNPDLRTETQINLSWSANGNPSGTYYYIEDINNSSRNSGWTTERSYSFTGLSANTTYSFRVKARNGDSVETDFLTTDGQIQTNPFVSAVPPVAPPPSDGADVSDPSAPETEKQKEKELEEEEYYPSGLIRILTPSGKPVVHGNNPNVIVKLDVNYADKVALVGSDGNENASFADISYDNIVPKVAWKFIGGDGKKCVNARFYNSVKGFQNDAFACMELDTTPPPAPVITAVSAGNLRIRPFITGTAEKNTRIIITHRRRKLAVESKPILRLAALSDFATYYADADDSGVWRHPFPDHFNIGTYDLTAIAEDKAGNRSEETKTDLKVTAAPADIELNVDIIKPEDKITTIEKPADEKNIPFRPTGEPPIILVPVSPPPDTGDVSKDGGKDNDKTADSGASQPLGDTARGDGSGQADASASGGGGFAETVTASIGAARETFATTVDQIKIGVAITADAVGKAVVAFGNTAKVVVKNVEVVVDNPVVEEVNETVAVPVITVVGVANAAAGGLPQILTFLRYLFSQPFLLLRRRRLKRWGTIYNAFTKRPVDLAMVRLIDAKTNRIVRSQVTDTIGRYLLIVDPGSYRLEVTRPGYIGVSQYLRRVTEDGTYVNLYQGQDFDVSEKNTQISYNIPLDPIGKTVSAARVIRDQAQKSLQYILSVSGVTIALVSFIVSPKPFVAGMLAFHVFLYMLFYLYAHKKLSSAWGVVTASDNQTPIASAVVRLFDVTYNKLIDTKVTDRKGRYAFLVGARPYYVTYEKAGFALKKSPVMDFTEKAQSKEGNIIARNEQLETVSAATRTPSEDAVLPLAVLSGQPANTLLAPPAPIELLPSAPPELLLPEGDPDQAPGLKPKAEVSADTTPPDIAP